MYCKQNKSVSFAGFKTPSNSSSLKIEENGLVTFMLMSRLKRSTCWLRIEPPTITLYKPLVFTMFCYTWEFSPPWSVLTRRGLRNESIALSKWPGTVTDRLLVQVSANVTNLLNSSMATWTTNPQRINFVIAINVPDIICTGGIIHTMPQTSPSSFHNSRRIHSMQRWP